MADILRPRNTDSPAIDDQIPMEMRRNGAMGAPGPSGFRIAGALVLILVTVVAGRCVEYLTLVWKTFHESVFKDPLAAAVPGACG